MALSGGGASAAAGVPSDFAPATRTLVDGSVRVAQHRLFAALDAIVAAGANKDPGAHASVPLTSPTPLLAGCLASMYGELRIDAAQAFSEADHVCWRCASVAEYQAVCALFGGERGLGRLLIESMVGGRPIATFALSDQIELRFRVRGSGAGCGAGGAGGQEGEEEEEVVRHIPCVEVPCPKPGRAYASGWEHVEWVVGTGRLEAFMDATGAARRGAEPVAWDLKAFAKAVNRDISREFTFSEAGASFPGSFKVHEEPLAAVIAHELATGSSEPVPDGYLAKH